LVLAFDPFFGFADLDRDRDFEGFFYMFLYFMFKDN
jgi:hypothetical protein